MCAVLATIIVACLGYVPDTSKTVSIPYRCVKQLGSYRAKAQTCAAENGVMWQIARKVRFRSRN